MLVIKAALTIIRKRTTKNFVTNTRTHAEPHMIASADTNATTEASLGTGTDDEYEYRC